MHKTTSTDDKRLQGTLKRLGVNTIPGIEEVRRRGWGFTSQGRSDVRQGNSLYAGPVVSAQTARLGSTTSTVCCSIAAARSTPPRCLLPLLQVLLINADGSALQFTNPKVQASIAANTYVVSGASQPKRECARRGSSSVVQAAIGPGTLGAAPCASSHTCLPAVTQTVCCPFRPPHARCPPSPPPSLPPPSPLPQAPRT